jgi:hypothetical protein
MNERRDDKRMRNDSPGALAERLRIAVSECDQHGYLATLVKSTEDAYQTGDRLSDLATDAARELERLSVSHPSAESAITPDVDDEMPLDPDAIRIQFSEWWAGREGDEQVAFEAYEAAAHHYKSSTPSSASANKLTKPAQVGNTIFGVGVDERMVIERAQREHDYMQTPEKEAVRIAASNMAFRSIHLQVALQELVELKAMKDGFGVPPFGEHNNDAARADYERRKPLAWERARELLAGVSPPSPEPALEPDGYAVLLDDPNVDGTPGGCGYWYVGAYRTEAVAKNVAERGKQGARVVPMYFAPPSSTRSAIPANTPGKG